MKILISGLDPKTTMFLRDKSVSIEEAPIEDATELQDWLIDDLYDSGVIDLEGSNLGIYAARGLRERKIMTPLIGISSGSEDRSWGEHRALFLENGGDDLLKNPVNPRELMATLQAVTRRFNGARVAFFERKYGDAILRVNLNTGYITLNNRPITLTGTERRLLVLLTSKPNFVFSKEKIVENLYGGMDEPELKIIDVFVCKVRKKLFLAHEDTDGCIGTVWGRGYKMMEERDTSDHVEVA